jgi:hypothetical protein
MVVLLLVSQSLALTRLGVVFVVITKVQEGSIVLRIVGLLPVEMRNLSFILLPNNLVSDKSVAISNIAGYDA